MTAWLIYFLLIVCHCLPGIFGFVRKSNTYMHHNVSQKVLIVQICDGKFEQKTHTDGEVPSMIDLSTISYSLYSEIYRYTYKRIIIERPESVLEGSHPTWLKVSALMEILSKDEVHDWIVVADLDTIVMDYTVSLEDKMHEWNPDGKADIFMAFGPEKWETTFVTLPNGTRVKDTNTGFMIFRNSLQNKLLAEEWYACRKTYCKSYNTFSYFEQTVFTKYFAYNLEYVPEGGLQCIPCSEANGYFISGVTNDWSYGEIGNGGCDGRFVSHFWVQSKNHINTRKAVRNQMQKVVEAGILHRVNNNPRMKHVMTAQKR